MLAQYSQLLCVLIHGGGGIEGGGGGSGGGSGGEGGGHSGI